MGPGLDSRFGAAFTGLLLLTAPAFANESRSAQIELINREHDSRLIADAEPYLAAEITEPAYRAKLAADGKCTTPPPGAWTPAAVLEECDHLMRVDLTERLRARYFAADFSAFRRICRADPFACRDPIVSELWLRKLHNLEIEKSRREKLARLARVPSPRVPGRVAWR